MFCFRPLRICGSENTPCVIFQCAHFLCFHSDACWYNRRRRRPRRQRKLECRGKRKHNARFPGSTFSAPAETATTSCFKRVHEAQVGSSKWYITRLHTFLLCTYLTWRIVCFLNILQVTKKKTEKTKTKTKKKRECTAFARVSVKFKAIFRAHRFLLIVIDHHWWTLNDGSDRSLVDSVYGKWLLMGGTRGEGGRGRRATFLFSRLLCSDEWKTKNHPQFSNWVFLGVGNRNRSIHGACSQILSPCVCSYWS